MKNLSLFEYVGEAIEPSPMAKSVLLSPRIHQELPVVEMSVKRAQMLSAKTSRGTVDVAMVLVPMTTEPVKLSTVNLGELVPTTSPP